MPGTVSARNSHGALHSSISRRRGCCCCCLGLLSLGTVPLPLLPLLLPPPLVAPFACGQQRRCRLQIVCGAAANGRIACQPAGEQPSRREGCACAQAMLPKLAYPGRQDESTIVRGCNAPEVAWQAIWRQAGRIVPPMPLFFSRHCHIASRILSLRCSQPEISPHIAVLPEPRQGAPNSTLPEPPLALFQPSTSLSSGMQGWGQPPAGAWTPSQGPPPGRQPPQPPALPPPGGPPCPAASQLSSELRERMERNRLEALRRQGERRQASQASAGPAPSNGGGYSQHPATVDSASSRPGSALRSVFMPQAAPASYGTQQPPPGSSYSQQPAYSTPGLTRKHQKQQTVGVHPPYSQQAAYSQRWPRPGTQQAAGPPFQLQQQQPAYSNANYGAVGAGDSGNVPPHPVAVQPPVQRGGFVFQPPPGLVPGGGSALPGGSLVQAPVGPETAFAVRKHLAGPSLPAALQGSSSGAACGASAAAGAQQAWLWQGGAAPAAVTSSSVSAASPFGSPPDASTSYGQWAAPPAVHPKPASRGGSRGGGGKAGAGGNISYTYGPPLPRKPTTQSTLEDALRRHEKAKAESLQHQQVAPTPAASGDAAACKQQLQQQPWPVPLHTEPALLATLASAKAIPTPAGHGSSSRIWGSHPRVAPRAASGLPPLPTSLAAAGRPSPMGLVSVQQRPQHQHQPLQQRVTPPQPLRPVVAPAAPSAAAPRWGPAAITPARQHGQPSNSEARRLKLQHVLCTDADPFAAAGSSGRCDPVLPAWAAALMPLLFVGAIASPDGLMPAANVLPPAVLLSSFRRWPWLASPRDVQGRPPSDADYDPTTLLIPPSAWQTDLKGSDARRRTLVVRAVDGVGHGKGTGSIRRSSCCCVLVLFTPCTYRSLSGGTPSPSF